MCVERMVVSVQQVPSATRPSGKYDSENDCNKSNCVFEAWTVIERLRMDGDHEQGSWNHYQGNGPAFREVEALDGVREVPLYPGDACSQQRTGDAIWQHRSSAWSYVSPGECGASASYDAEAHP